MSRILHLVIIAVSCVAICGCSRRVDQSNQPTQPYMFLGIAEDQTSNEGPVGLIGEQSVQVANVSKVQEVPYSEYLLAKDASKVAVEERHAGFIYWAVKEVRDVHFQNATAWTTVLERYKSPLQ